MKDHDYLAAHELGAERRGTPKTRRPYDGQVEPSAEVITPPRERPRRRRATLALGATAVVAAGVAAGFLVLVDEGDRSPRAAERRPFAAESRAPHAAAIPSRPKSASGYATAYVPRRTVLYDAPGGKRRVRIEGRTQWGSARILGVVRIRDGWLGVQAPELRNHELGWIPGTKARVYYEPYSLHADLSRRELSVRRKGRTVRRMRIAVGRPANPTPTGRFSVTDRLIVTDKGSPYGCCILALTGHQVRLPSNWPGGDRLAVHATRNLQSIGTAASLGCMRSTDSEVRWLVDTIPIGAPIFIRS